MLLVGRVMTGETYHAYFNPERAMPAAAENVHGLSDKFLSDKPLFAQKADDLLAFLGDSPLVAHNASFDFGFLNNELQRCGREAIGLDRMVDTVALARVRHPGAKLSLDALCTRYGIDRSHRTGGSGKRRPHGSAAMTIGRIGDHVPLRSLDIYQAIGAQLATGGRP